MIGLPRLAALLGSLALLLIAHPPARADDLEIASRGVVRVVSAVIAGDQLLDLSTGSGFAVAPDRIVTNAHVVANGRGYTRGHYVRVIPSDGRPMVEAWLEDYDADRDLAVLRVKEPVKTLAIHTGELSSDTEVRAFGYPGNVDRAVSSDPLETLQSMPPVRSPGIVSGWRVVDGVQMILTSAPIARGNSGGPLTDLCGRVLGVNTVITRADDGEGSFAFAISTDDLLKFLAEADVPHVAHDAPCVTRAGFAETQAKLAAAEAALVQPSQFAGATVEEAPPSRHPLAGFGIAAVLITSGSVLLWRRRNSWGMLALSGGLAVLAGAAMVRTGEGEPVSQSVTAPDTPVVTEALYACSLDRQRSRVLHSDTANIEFRWRSDGCANGRTQYLGVAGAWTRIFVSERQQSVTVNRMDTAARQFVMERSYPQSLDLAKMAANTPEVAGENCPLSPEDQRALEAANADLAAMIDRPDEVLTYRCEEK